MNKFVIFPGATINQLDATELCISILSEKKIEVPTSLQPHERTCLLWNKEHKITMYCDGYEDKTPRYNFVLRNYFGPKDRFGVAMRCAPFTIQVE